MDRSEYPIWVTVQELVARFVTDADLSSTLSWLSHRCAQLPGASASALLLADEDDVLVVAASSDHRPEELEGSGLDGPAQASYDQSCRIDCPDLSEAGALWPDYSAAALQAELRAVHAFPLWIPARTIGVLTLYAGEPGGLPDGALETWQALASTAALGITGHQAAQDKVRADQLQVALDSRVLIEQAKGLLAERHGTTPDEAFAVLRKHARSNHRRLVDVCAAVLDGDLTLSQAPSEVAGP